MKKEELRKKLQDIGIPQNLYTLESIGRKDERFCLEYIDNEWHVYFSERGIKTTDKVFSKEEDACQYLYEQLCD